MRRRGWRNTGRGNGWTSKAKTLAMPPVRAGAWTSAFSAKNGKEIEKMEKKQRKKPRYDKRGRKRMMNAGKMMTKLRREQEEAESRKREIQARLNASHDKRKRLEEENRELRDRLDRANWQIAVYSEDLLRLEKLVEK